MQTIARVRTSLAVSLSPIIFRDTGEQPMMSDFGTRLSSQPFTAQGRAVGQVLQMRNLNLAPKEKRTYTALNEGTSSAGGDSVPVDFFAEVIEQMRQFDELFVAARWITTPTGRSMTRTIQHLIQRLWAWAPR